MYAATYNGWKLHASGKKYKELTDVIKKFTLDLLIVKKRSEDGMTDPTLKEKLLACPDARLKLVTKFNNRMEISIHPDIFIKLIQIGKLFAVETKRTESVELER